MYTIRATRDQNTIFSRDSFFIRTVSSFRGLGPETMKRPFTAQFLYGSSEAHAESKQHYIPPDPTFPDALSSSPTRQPPSADASLPVFPFHTTNRSPCICARNKKISYYLDHSKSAVSQFTESKKLLMLTHQRPIHQLEEP